MRTFPCKHKAPQLLCWPLQLSVHVILEVLQRLNLPSHGTNLHTQHTESFHHQLHLQDQDMAVHKCNTCLESYGCNCSDHSQHFCSETNYKVPNKIMVPVCTSVLWNIICYRADSLDIKVKGLWWWQISIWHSGTAVTYCIIITFIQGFCALKRFQVWGTQNFKNLGATPKTLGDRRLKSRMFHRQNPQTLSPTIHNLVIQVTWWLECVHPRRRVCIVMHENKSTLSAW